MEKWNIKKIDILELINMGATCLTFSYRPSVPSLNRITPWKLKIIIMMQMTVVLDTLEFAACY